MAQGRSREVSGGIPGGARDRRGDLRARVLAESASSPAGATWEELAQVAAEQVGCALPRFEGRSQLSTWTFRICYLTIRKHDRWYRRWLRRFTLTRDGELPEPAGDEDASDARLSGNERRERLRSALEQLSPKRRAVIVLHDLEGLAIDEIAAVVGRRPGGRALAAPRRAKDAHRDHDQTDPYFGDEACQRKAKEWSTSDLSR